MEQNKLDQAIKSKLEKRTIKPSSDSWDALSERLDNEVKQKRGLSYLWIGLAASFIGVLFFLSQFSSKTIETNEDINVIVDTQESLENIQYEDTPIISSKEALIKNQNEDKAENETIQPPQKDMFNPPINNILVENQERIGDQRVIGQEKINVLEKDSLFEEQKIQEVVAQVMQLEKEQDKITDADIDVLLLEAQKSIARNRLYNETNGKVDANALLESVEDELDQSFRTRVLEAIKTSYNKVKTAVAQRNE